jgi:formate hydrogenlyase transcriptional activator
MESATQSPAKLILNTKDTQNAPGLLSSESVLNILRLILAGAPLAEVLTIIAQLVESSGDGTLCTIWLPHDDGKQLYCAAAPSLPGFIIDAGAMMIGPKGGSCGTAVYRKEPVYVNDILTDSIWDNYRHRLLPFGIRAVWSWPLFTSEGRILGTFAIHYREPRSPDAVDLQLIENASHIAGIAIERYLNEESLRLERDRLHLLLEITNSITSKLDLHRLVETLSTKLLRVTQCDFCALLLPDADNTQLRATMLYNPAGRGVIVDGAMVPLKGSTCGKAFLTEKKSTYQQARRP